MAGHLCLKRSDVRNESQGNFSRQHSGAFTVSRPIACALEVTISTNFIPISSEIPSNTEPRQRETLNQRLTPATVVPGIECCMELKFPLPFPQVEDTLGPRGMIR